jgi:hypothetical protein
MRLRGTMGLCALACLAAGARAADDYVWWEGEAPAAKSEGLKDQHPFKSPDSHLSGGKSIGGDVGPGAFLEYDVEIPQDGTYRFYVRKFWHHGPFKWKFDTDEFQTVDNFPLLDSVELAKFLCVNWVLAGKVKLVKGAHKLRLESIKKGGLVFDCFCLSLKPFVPGGLRKPGEKLGLADEGKWAFEPDYDAFDKPALLDLRPLNEKAAGESGYVQATKDGDFALGNGKPVHFWCANTGVQGNPGTEDLELHAKHLAKRGINMVRHHGHLNPGKDQKITEVDGKSLEEAQKLVAVMKKEGIYTTVSPYWANSEAGPSWGIKGHTGGALHGLLFWDEDFQRAYKGWVKELMTRPNPYDKDKTPLAKDPGLAIFQIQNEDSFLFWTTQIYTKPENREKLARLQAVYDKWRKEKGKEARPLVIRFWELGRPTQDHKDTMWFFAETMHAWNKELARFLREDVGYKGLINAGNWRTADQVKLLDLERWSYTANEVIGVNRYVTSTHFNLTNEWWRQGYAIDRGDCFQDLSALVEPRKLAVNAKQVAGQTYIIPESCWVPPMSCQSEGPFLVAAYSSLNGVDGYYWFATGDVGWSQGLSKWTMAEPSQMGGWPAAALMFRKNYVKRGEPVVHEERALSDMWDLKSTVIAEEEGFDPNRDANNLPKECNIKGGVDPLAYLVGTVEVKYGGDPAKSTAADLTKYHDKEKKTVKSITGELEWNYGTGVCTLNAPAAQGATGFLSKAGPVKLDAVSLEGKNEYATVLVVSLDEKPLASSKKILVQVTTQCRPYGWRQSPAKFQDREKKQSFEGFRVDATGSSPWNVVNTDLTVTVRSAGVKKATQLDPNGYALKELKGETQGGAFVLKLPPNAMYVVLE